MKLTVLSLTKDGLIKRILLDELTLITDTITTVYAVLDDHSGLAVKKALKQEEDMTLSPKKNTTPYQTLQVCCMPDARYLMLSDVSLDVTHRNFAKKIIHASGKKNASFQNSPRENETYNEIQKLNNQLVNKTREVAKLNRDLNRANRILSNRLVEDPLTKLVSRYQYPDEIENALQKHPDKNAIFCFIDIDDFKEINDTYGHELGDRYLVGFADRLKNLIFRNSIKMRIAGDEFGVFIYNLNASDAAFIDRLWVRFKETVVKPIDIDGKRYPLKLSMGIARYPEDSTNINQLIDFADYAMYRAKNNGKNNMRLFDKTIYDAHKHPTKPQKNHA